MKIVFLSKFSKDLDKITVQSVKAKIAHIISEAEAANTIYDIKNIKKLSGDKISYRIRLGDYRIGLYLEKNTIEFARVVHRKNIYKVFP